MMSYACTAVFRDVQPLDGGQIHFCTPRCPAQFVNEFDLGGVGTFPYSCDKASTSSKVVFMFERVTTEAFPVSQGRCVHTGCSERAR